MRKHDWRSGGTQLTLARVGDRAGRVRTVALRHGRDIGSVLAVLVNMSSSSSSLSSAVAGRGAWVLAFSYMHAMAHRGAGMLCAAPWGVARWHTERRVAYLGKEQSSEPRPS